MFLCQEKLEMVRKHGFLLACMNCLKITSNCGMFKLSGHQVTAAVIAGESGFLKALKFKINVQILFLKDIWLDCGN